MTSKSHFIKNLIENLSDINQQQKAKEFMYSYWSHIYSRCRLEGFRYIGSSKFTPDKLLNHLCRALLFDSGCISIAFCFKDITEENEIKRQHQLWIAKRAPSKEFIESSIEVLCKNESIQILLEFSTYLKEKIRRDYHVNINKREFKNLKSLIAFKYRTASSSFDVLMKDCDDDVLEELILFMSYSFEIRLITKEEATIEQYLQFLLLDRFIVNLPGEKVSILRFGSLDELRKTYIKMMADLIQKYKTYQQEFTEQYKNNFASVENLRSEIHHWFALVKKDLNIDQWSILADPNCLILKYCDELVRADIVSKSAKLLIKILLVQMYILKLNLEQSVRNTYLTCLFAIDQYLKRFSINKIKQFEIKLTLFLFIRTQTLTLYRTGVKTILDLVMASKLLPFTGDPKPSIETKPSPEILKEYFEYNDGQNLLKTIQQSLITNSIDSYLFLRLIRRELASIAQQLERYCSDIFIALNQEGFHAEICIPEMCSKEDYAVKAIGCSHLSCPQCFVGLVALMKKHHEIHAPGVHSCLYAWNVIPRLMKEKYRKDVLGSTCYELYKQFRDKDITFNTERLSATARKKIKKFKKMRDIFYGIIQNMASVAAYIAESSNQIISLSLLSTKILFGPNEKQLKDIQSNSIYIQIGKKKLDIDQDASYPLSPEIYQPIDLDNYYDIAILPSPSYSPESPKPISVSLDQNTHDESAADHQQASVNGYQGPIHETKLYTPFLSKENRTTMYTDYDKFILSLMNTILKAIVHSKLINDTNDIFNYEQFLELFSNLTLS
ncbi:hypothetical protein TrispH2_006677 [Trichoplax sp. H2]|uniref:Uncharacterized protein n=1 Tax=Trichoplax adhaerens TaxID=10228 RepID=B3RW32_TRIAD|nr:predicted protein [Trichoplax adhaerens]EDV25600.1 predicted protein [Trichoplax adhaerens]RDD41451.1 hypothetical protein TrispH2_006677 [Trichoplax sp. H2]|eukprot:XP_002111633.1 predicted protein [Trichoplax adhaerens]